MQGNFHSAECRYCEPHHTVFHLLAGDENAVFIATLRPYGVHPIGVPKCEIFGMR